MLVFGPEGALPGTGRSLEGLPYRLIIPPYPATWEAYLNEPRLGDDALHDLLLDLVAGRVRRAGEALAEFGVGWVAFTEPSPLQILFEAQLDLVPLRSLDFPVFRNEVAAFAAIGDDGRGWESEGTGYAAPDGGSSAVFVASNADFRWGPGDWSQSGWGSEVSAAAGVVDFSGHNPRRMMAFGSLAWLLALVAVVALDRRQREEESQ